MMRYITNNVIFVFVCKWVSAPLRLLPLNNREQDEFYQIQWGFSPKQNFNHLAGFDPYTPCFQNLSNGINGQHPPVTLIGKLSGFRVAPSSKCHRFDPFNSCSCCRCDWHSNPNPNLLIRSQCAGSGFVQWAVLMSCIRLLATLSVINGDPPDQWLDLKKKVNNCRKQTICFSSIPNKHDPRNCWDI